MNRGKPPWRVLGRIAICVILLVWVFHAISMQEGRRSRERQGGTWDELTRAEQWEVAWSEGPRELWSTLTLVRPLEGACSVGFMGLTILLGMLRWRIVLGVQGLHLPLARAAEISWVAHFFNSFLLGSTGGDLMKAYYAARETHHLKTEAVVTVFVDRLLGLLSMLLFAVVMVLPNRALFMTEERLTALAVVIFAALCGGLVLAGLSFRGGLSRRWPHARAWLARLPKGEMLERSLDACRRFGRAPGALLKALGLSMVINVVCVLQIWVLARGLDVSVDPMLLFAIVPMVICISAVPITPSGLGVRENLYVWTLASPAIGVPPTQALSLSLLAYAGSLVWSLVGGMVYLTFKRRHHLAEAARDGADEPDNP